MDRRLAATLASLVRVSRRVVCSHDSNIDAKTLSRRSPALEYECRDPCRLAASSRPRQHHEQTLVPLAISSTFHSLSKVLFTFPSRYLFAIGLLAVFSLGSNLRPILGLHSQATRLLDSGSWGGAGDAYGGITLFPGHIPELHGASPPQIALR
jgi:hypothetical protein